MKMTHMLRATAIAVVAVAAAAWTISVAGIGDLSSPAAEETIDAAVADEPATESGPHSTAPGTTVRPSPSETEETEETESESPDPTTAAPITDGVGDPETSPAPEQPESPSPQDEPSKKDQPKTKSPKKETPKPSPSDEQSPGDDKTCNLLEAILGCR